MNASLSARFRSFVRICPVLLLLVLLGCSDDDTTSPPQPSPGDENVGPAGGTVTSDDGRVSLAVPAGALVDSLEITLEPVASPPAGALAGTVYDCGPDGTVFSVPAELTVRYDPEDLPAGSFHRDLRLCARLAGNWIPLAGGTVDSAARTVATPIGHFSTYGIAVPGESGDIDSLTVILVDAPDPGDPRQFSTLTAALDHLATQLGYEDLGILSWRTSTPQSVDALAFAYDLRIDLEEGQAGVIVGPGAVPLVIDAGGAIQLADFTIHNAGGLVLNGNRRVDVTSSMLPGTTTVNIGGVKSAPFPAADPEWQGKQAAAGRATGARFSTNALAESLQMNLTGGVAVGGTYDLRSNTAPSLYLGGSAPLGLDGKLELWSNISDEIQLEWDLEFNAGMAVGYHDANDILIDSSVSGTHELALQYNVATNATVKVDGLGELTVRASSEDIVNGRFDIGVTAFRFEGISPVYSQLLFAGAALVLGEVDYAIDLVGAAISENLTCDFALGENGNLDLSLENLTDVRNVTLRSGLTTTAVWNDFAIQGALDIVARANLMDVTQSGVDVHGAVQASTEGFTGGLNWFVTDAHFDGSVQAWGVGLFIKFTETIHDDAIVVDATSPKAGHPAHPGREDPQILLDRIEWSGSAADGVEIVGASIPVVVERCVFSLNEPVGPALRILECSGTVSVDRCQFTGNGITVLDSPGAISLTDNSIELAGGSSAAINLGASGDATVSGNMVTCGAGILAAVTISGMDGTTTFTGNSVTAGDALQALAIGENHVVLTGNDPIEGMISIVTGPVQMTGNNLTAASISDILGGLMNDPVTANDGLSPYSVYTVCDFDGNGCCEYPPPNNEPDEHGQCPCEGVEPPVM